jgi:hypothetical protein
MRRSLYSSSKQLTSDGTSETQSDRCVHHQSNFQAITTLRLRQRTSGIRGDRSYVPKTQSKSDRCVHHQSNFQAITTLRLRQRTSGIRGDRSYVPKTQSKSDRCIHHQSN